MSWRGKDKFYVPFSIEILECKADELQTVVCYNFIRDSKPANNIFPNEIFYLGVSDLGLSIRVTVRVRVVFRGNTNFFGQTRTRTRTKLIHGHGHEHEHELLKHEHELPEHELTHFDPKFQFVSTRTRTTRTRTRTTRTRTRTRLFLTQISKTKASQIQIHNIIKIVLVCYHK